MSDHVRPADIERTSMEIISTELLQRGLRLPEEYAPVVKRAIHTTADFDYAENLFFTRHAVNHGVKALTDGAVIVTDTNMTLAGISKPALKKLGAEAVCFMADEAVAAKAKELSITRAACSMEHAAGLYPKGIYAVGNAPTALLKLSELMEQGLKPSLIIGVPVGFVNVVESKEQLRQVCLRYDVPAIIAMGRKGGSNVSAAIVNALLYTASDMLDPVNRGWH